MQKTLYSSGYQALLGQLRNTRLERSVTQDELSKRIGLTQSDISKVERGVRRLDVLELRVWLRGLDTGLVDFIASLEERLTAMESVDDSRRALKK